MKNKLLLLTILLFSILTFSQDRTLKGIVSYDGKNLSDIKIHIDNDEFKTTSNANGYYELKLTAGIHKLIFFSHDYGKKIEVVDLTNETSKTLNVSFSEEVKKIAEVKLNHKSAIKELRETPYNMIAIDAKLFYNTTLDLGHLLDKASGVKIREAGGVGSDMNVSLNGFTGNHVKIFMDGVPMQGFGAAFQLNNIPVGIANRIEVYKGVVPIEFGADALGGVINIVTNQSQNSYMDFSTSYGSFNTHKTNINAGYTSQSGFTVQLNAFQNSSDNNYKVKTEVLDLATGNRPNTQYWVRRFNDAYHNETMIAKIGFVKKSWADRFIIGGTFGHEYSEVQNGSDMKFVFGEKNQTSKSNLYSLNYEKRNLFFKNLNVKINANYNQTENKNNDTINRQYNWFGEYITTNVKGEYGNATLSRFRNKNYSVTANISYDINPQHSIMINNVLTGYKRKNTDEATLNDPDTVNDTIKRKNMKNVLGISYRYSSKNKKWTSNIFGKQYNVNVTGPFNKGDAAHPNYLEQNAKSTAIGYGLATTYTFRDIQVKASAERVYRLPTDRELFGDETLEIANSILKPENSLNYNLGASLTKQIGKSNNIYLDVNAYYRDTKDYILRQNDQREGGYTNTNFGNVKNLGVDVEARYFYKNKLAIGGNATYQDIRNYEKYAQNSSAQLSQSYKDRLKNVPYLFGNLDATYYFHDIWGKDNVLSIGYTFNYIYEFYLNWPSIGDASTKAKIPTQRSNDISITYSFQKGKYNIAFEGRDLNNELLYDNYSLQKPGRSFAIKFRYFITNRKTK